MARRCCLRLLAPVFVVSGIAPSHALPQAYAPALSNDIIATVNDRAPWRAHRNSRFEGMSVAQAQHLLGVISPVSSATAPQTLKNTTSASSAGERSFDARAAWPSCIGSVQDQGNCGACWAVAAAEAMSDRLCISKTLLDGKPHFVQLSAMDLTSCDFEGDNMGCLGGVPLPAWEYAQRSGIVTNACMPYLKADGGSIDTCDPQPNCSLDKHDAAPYCTQMCTNFSIDYESDKHRLTSAYSVESSPDSIAKEIEQYGPVEVTFSVYQDFLHYASGVYRHVTGEFMGKHAVKLLGFGNDPSSGMDYWIVANSWSKSWGDEGFFKIAKGTDECFIESEVTAGRFSQSHGADVVV